MKYQFYILLCILIKVSISKEKINSFLKKQINDIHTGILDIDSDAIGFNNSRNGISRAASSSQMASRFSKIPPNHPVLVVRIDNSF
jgi:hypothetical protein